MKKFKRIIYIILLLIFLIAIGITIFLHSFNINSYKSDIEQALSSAMFREVKISSDIEFIPALNPTIVMQNIVIKNHSSSTVNPNFLEIKKVFISFDMWSLLLGVLKINKLEIDNPYLYLEKNKKGQGNWAFVDNVEPSSQLVKDKENHLEEEVKKLGFTPTYKFGISQINNGNVSYYDESKNKKYNIKIPLLKIHGNGELELTTSFQEHQIFLNGKIDNLQKLLNKDTNTDFNLSLHSNNNNINLFGHINNVYELSGLDIVLKASGNNLNSIHSYNISAKVLGDIDKLKISDIEATAGDKKELSLTLQGKIDNLQEMKGIDLHIKAIAKDPSYFGLQPFTLTANINEVKNLKSVAGKTSFVSGKNVLQGNFGLDMSSKIPYVFLKLHSDYFALFDVITDNKKVANDNSNEQTKNSDNVFVFSDDKIPFDKLLDFNSDIKIDISELYFNNKKTSSTLDFSGSLKQGELLSSLSIKSKDSYDLNTKFDAKISSQKPPAFAIKMNGKDMSFNDLLGDTFRKDFKGGKFSFIVDATTAGDTMHTLASKLNGKFLLLLQNVVVSKTYSSWLGKDFFNQIAGIFTSILHMDKQPSSEDLEVQCLAGKMNFTDGQTTFNRGLVLESKKAFVTANGNINLASEHFDIALEVMSREGIRTGLSDILSGMIKIGGSFSDPTVSVNAGGVVNTVATVGTALITGGLSFIGQTLMSTTFKDSSPCKTVLGDDYLKMQNKVNEPSKNKKNQTK